MRLFVFIVVLLVTAPNVSFAFGTSLGDMYRNIVKIENGDEVPNYVKKHDKEKQKPAPQVVETKQNLPPVVYAEKTLEEKYRQRVRLSKLKEKISELETKEDKKKAQDEITKKNTGKDWLEIVRNVQMGYPTPFDVEEIKRRVELKDGEAVELYAWMKANGVGCKQDLQKAWLLYSLASRIGVKDAGKNANAVYKAMTAYQKENLVTF
jgi:TPR repeat protein